MAETAKRTETVWQCMKDTYRDVYEEVAYVLKVLRGYPSAIGLYWWLKEHRKHETGATPPFGDSLINKETDMPPRTIQDARRRLINSGLVSCEGGKGKGHRTVYHFLYPWRKPTAHRELYPAKSHGRGVEKTHGTP